MDRKAWEFYIDIDAPAERVWSFVVQFGLGRAGFYSYELLERLVGIPVTNVESVEPAWQSLQLGDEVVLHPKAPGIPVAIIEADSMSALRRRQPTSASCSGGAIGGHRRQLAGNSGPFIAVLPAAESG